MSILPGIYASQITGHLVTGSYESIATVNVGSGGQANITFSSIPSTYKHLQIRMMSRKSTNGSTQNIMQFNGDTGANYKAHYIIAFADGIYYGSDGPNNIGLWFTAANNALANTFAATVIDVLDYQDTNKYKTTRAINGDDYNGSGDISFLSGLWTSTSAINSITLAPLSGNFVQYSQAALYGIKG